MSFDEVALDAVVDSLLQSRSHSSSAAPAPAQPYTPVQSDVWTRSSRTVAPAQSRPTAQQKHDGHGVASAAAAAAVSSSRNYRTSSRNSGRQEKDDDEEEEEEEEEDLNALVERILAGPKAASGPPSSSTSTAHVLSHRSSSHHPHHHQHQQQQHHEQEYPLASSPSVSPTGSSPRFQAALQRPSQGRGGTGASETSKKDKHSSGPRRATAVPYGAGGRGATRAAESSLSRSRGGGGAASASGTPMDAVVRRLALWQERKEAKRVQSVYEALEKEQAECTFEPSINRLAEGEEPLGGGGSREAEGRQRASLSTPSYTSERTAGGVNYAGPHVPALDPPPQPIVGLESFVDRLRRVQEERDAARAAEEAHRLHFYDPASFRRGVTQVEPFELSETRPRHYATSTVPVRGLPSPLSRLRAASAVRDAAPSSTSLTVSPSRLSLTPSAVAATTAASSGPCRTPYAAYTEYRRSPLNPREDGDDDYPHVSGTAAGYAMEEGEEGDVGGDDEVRLTAENTFLSLAPQIRELLLFDRGMEQQLQRATQSIRRGNA